MLTRASPDGGQRGRQGPRLSWSVASTTRSPFVRLLLAAIAFGLTTLALAGLLAVVFAVLLPGESTVTGLVTGAAGFNALYGLLFAPMLGRSDLWFRLGRSARMIRRGERARWRASYGDEPHVTGWDLWGAPYLFREEGDVAREQADLDRYRQRRQVGPVWVGPGRTRTLVADLPAWSREHLYLQTFELRGSRWSSLWHLGGSLAFVAGSAYLVRTGDWRGWPLMVLSGVLCAGSLLSLVKPERVVLSPSGIVVRGVRRPTEYAWDRCGRFRVMETSYRGSRIVSGVRFAYDSDGLPQRSWWYRGEGWLPGTFGHGGEELCEFLEILRKDSLAVGAQPPD